MVIFDRRKKVGLTKHVLGYEFYYARVFTQTYHAIGIETILYLILLVSFIPRTEKEFLPSLYKYELFRFGNPAKLVPFGDVTKSGRTCMVKRKRSSLLQRSYNRGRPKKQHWLMILGITG